MGMETAKRRFTIADGMILIAALAAGLAWSARAWAGFQKTMPRPAGSLLWFREWAVLILVMALPSVMFSTIAVATLRVVRPRPSWLRISRQPGMIASFVTLFALAISLPPIGIGIAIIMSRQPPDPDFWRDLPGNLLEVLAMAAPAAGFAIIVAWTVLAVQRRWRCERTWIDFAGRMLGVVWILSGALFGWVLVEQLVR